MLDDSDISYLFTDNNINTYTPQKKPPNLD